MRPEHRGMIQVDPYVLFPENRAGNAVYLNNEMLLSLPGRTIIDVLPLPVEGRFAYVASNEAGEMELGVQKRDQDGAVRIDKISKDVFHAVMVLDGVVYKKMFRLIENKILDLLPSSKTPDGAVAGPGGVVFFHVASTTMEDRSDGTQKQVFGLKVHVTQGEEERLKSLSYLVQNGLPKLEFSWVDETTIRYKLSDGKQEEVSLSQFQ